ncbi:hypothetical protein BDD12DRAFT_805509 [Trichophaea hybrida]|nr:hypothetical protein BDD12DRAFT_805509 [Trichophaea hybrida]
MSTDKKPDFVPLPPSSDLLSRLNSFLPQLSTANASLEAEIAAAGNADTKNIEHVSDDEEQYIEMNLGLGVLEEICSEDEDSDSSAVEKNTIAALLNPTPAQKPAIQLVSEENKEPHGVKRSAPPDSDSDSDSDSFESEEKKEKIELETILSASKRHGKGPRGKPSIEEVVENKSTPTPEKQVQRR